MGKTYKHRYGWLNTRGMPPFEEHGGDYWITSGGRVLMVDDKFAEDGMKNGMTGFKALPPGIECVTTTGLHVRS